TLLHCVPPTLMLPSRNAEVLIKLALLWLKVISYFAGLLGISALCDMAISISLQCLGLIILAAILLQTVAVAISFMYFNKVLNTVRHAFWLRCVRGNASGSSAACNCCMKTTNLWHKRVTTGIYAPRCLAKPI
ncbi:hypothetical protein ATANTOWER_011117, partial [Ataeniobius toweri]|nr:hypothetical protein [Ataeniobius toweri]